MPEGLVTGLKGTAKVTVSEVNTAEAFGNIGAKVFATPLLVGLMEQAAIAAIQKCLAAGEGTVGTRIEMNHLAATPIGMSIEASAELVEIQGKKLVFEISASDELEIVGKCRHERYLLNNVASFLAKADSKRQHSC